MIVRGAQPDFKINSFMVTVIARGSVIKRHVQRSARRFRWNVSVDGYTSGGVRS
jgi:hypothetical protein